MVRTSPARRYRDCTGEALYSLHLRTGSKYTSCGILSTYSCTVLYCTYACTYLLRSTRFDYDNTRLRVGFSWLLLKLLFAKLTVKGVAAVEFDQFILYFVATEKTGFVVCVTNNVFLCACTQYSKIKLRMYL